MKTRLFGYKASFEAYVTLTDAVESAKLEKFGQHLQELENNLPLEARYRNPKLGASAPMRVVNEVFSSGEGNSGVQTAAFNLPNDERVVKEKGSARIMLKNVQDAKFNKVLIPISRVVLESRAATSRRLRFVFHAHPDARADARSRPTQHQRWRPAHHGALAAQGALFVD